MLSLIILAVLLMSPSVMSVLPSTDVGDATIKKMAVIEDSWIENSVVNHNADIFLSIANLAGSGNKIQRSLLKFEAITTSDCAVDNIRQASMYVHFNGDYKTDSDYTGSQKYHTYRINVNAVKSAWTDSQVTGKIRQTGENWSEDMLDIKDQDAEVEAQGCYKSIYPLRPAGFVEFDVTEIVRRWADSTTTNNGVLLWASNENKDGVYLRFASEQHTDTAKRAFINVLCDD